MKIFTCLCFAILFLISSSVPALAQQEIPEAKRKLIAELMELTEAKSQIIRITDSMLENMETIYPVMLRENLKQTELTDEEQEAFSKHVEEGYKEFSEKFRKRLPQVIDYDDYIVRAAYPKYDKYFTEKELSEMVEFYKTETGRKVVRVLPELSDEMMKSAEEYLTPKLMKLVDDILQESFSEDDVVIQDGPPPPPAPKRDG